MPEYIEREALIKKIVNTPTVPIRQCYQGNFVYADGTASRQNEIIDYINNQPTADVVKVRHGEWLSNAQTDELVCSECDGISPVDCEKEDFYESNYCPNCGAKMDGKDDSSE